ncbi:MAG: hypothetical protein IJC73_09325 [Lentisphaeria bacterium]|nr:hypothetical protein [Lentisphaeria bacterium]
MKRKIVYILLSMVIAAALCACGDTAMRNDVTVTTTPNMTNAPVATPRMDDGAVTDRDGIIEDNMPNDSIVQSSPKADSNKTDGAKASAQPTNSAKPTATTKP